MYSIHLFVRSRLRCTVYRLSDGHFVDSLLIVVENGKCYFLVFLILDSGSSSLNTTHPQSFIYIILQTDVYLSYENYCNKKFYLVNIYL